MQATEETNNSPARDQPTTGLKRSLPNPSPMMSKLRTVHIYPIPINMNCSVYQERCSLCIFSFWFRISRLSFILLLSEYLYHIPYQNQKQDDPYHETSSIECLNYTFSLNISPLSY